jgi:hypothetical protein
MADHLPLWMIGRYFLMRGLRNAWPQPAMARCYADFGDRHVIQFTSLKMSHLDAFEQEPVARLKHLR